MLISRNNVFKEPLVNLQVHCYLVEEISVAISLQQALFFWFPAWVFTVSSVL